MERQINRTLTNDTTVHALKTDNNKPRTNSMSCSTDTSMVGYSLDNIKSTREVWHHFHMCNAYVEITASIQISITISLENVMYPRLFLVFLLLPTKEAVRISFKVYIFYEAMCYVCILRGLADVGT